MEYGQFFGRYLSDTMSSDTPWLLWEYNNGGLWQTGNKDTIFLPSFEYRRKVGEAERFDLALAQTGNVVQFSAIDGWLDMESSIEYIGLTESNDLIYMLGDDIFVEAVSTFRMKPKVPNKDLLGQKLPKLFGDRVLDPDIAAKAMISINQYWLDKHTNKD